MPRLASELGVMSEAALGCVWGRWGQTSTQEDTLEPVSGPCCLGLTDTGDSQEELALSTLEVPSLGPQSSCRWPGRSPRGCTDSK